MLEFVCMWKCMHVGLEAITCVCYVYAGPGSRPPLSELVAKTCAILSSVRVSQLWEKHHREHAGSTASPAPHRPLWGISVNEHLWGQEVQAAA